MSYEDEVKRIEDDVEDNNRYAREWGQEVKSFILKRNDFIRSVSCPEVVAVLSEKRTSLHEQIRSLDLIASERHQHIEKTAKTPFEKDLRHALVEAMVEKRPPLIYVRTKYTPWFEPTISDLEAELKNIDRAIYDIENPENPDVDIEAVKDRIDISELASRYNFAIEKDNGTKKYTCCPFHEDKTPSFVLYDDSNSYHCFSCGENGDILDLIMKLDNVTFKGAVEILRKL